MSLQVANVGRVLFAEMRAPLDAYNPWPCFETSFFLSHSPQAKQLQHSLPLDYIYICNVLNKSGDAGNLGLILSIAKIDHS